MPTVRIPTPLRQATKGNAEVKATGDTVDDVVTDLERQFPGLKERLVDETGELARHRRRPLIAVDVMGRLRVRLTFPTNLIQEPIIYRLVKDFDILVNIRRADVKEDHGWVALELDAKDETTLENGVAWLKAKGVQVDPIEHDVIVP